MVYFCEVDHLFWYNERIETGINSIKTAVTNMLLPADQRAVDLKEITRAMQNKATQNDSAIVNSLGYPALETLYENIDASTFWLNNAGMMLNTPSIDRLSKVMNSQTLTPAAKMLQMRQEIPALSKFAESLQGATNGLTDNINEIVDGARPKSTTNGKRLLDLATGLGLKQANILASPELTEELFSLTQDMGTLTTITGRDEDQLQKKLNTIIDKNLGPDAVARVRKMNLTADKLNNLIIPEITRSLQRFDNASSNIKTHY